ncbi:PREDICTED: membrane-spanning 4-domains subfamily A member 8-like [Miniopterus natalensis]|uniref:membrane-spanning 4-domains subfamily A member 8-like n=1 Tax=Miniopterus natalensis TaxID=291302 RepID=UPI0007A7010D|nr:PREDICTED: membrane-spanning 4-domains subfamily A member 8-like [Miniopterus natalensis]
MNSMTSACRMPNSVFVVTSRNRYPVTPGSMSQVPLYPLSQPQVHLIPGNPHRLEPPVCTQPDQRSLKEGKVLGAIQILIGLIHIGLGSIMGTILLGVYTPVSLYGGYPFWAGVWFIISGSLTVASEKQPNSSCLLNGSLGLNIISIICSMVGIMLFITDMSVNSLYMHSDYYPYWGVAPGLATSAVLLVFSLLEFGIASTAASFGCQSVRYSSNSVSSPLVIPNIYVTNPVANPEPVNLPPPYSSEAPESQ